MLGFIKKDLAMIKSNFKILGVLLVIYVAMSLMGEMDISFILPFMSVMLMITTFSYDNYNKWDAYAITLPDGRRNSVRAKYVATILMILAMAVLTFILSIVIALINNETINYDQLLASMFGAIFGTLLVLTFMYPIIYKVGLEKARILIFVIIFGIAIFGGLVLQFVDLSFIGNALSFLEKYLILILLIIAAVMVYASYKISQKIFMKKGF